MKVCEVCGEEIYTQDGENRCADCDAKEVKKAKRRRQRRIRDGIMRDLGLVKVRGNLGGTFWE